MAGYCRKTKMKIICILMSVVIFLAFQPTPVIFAGTGTVKQAGLPTTVVRERALQFGTNGLQRGSLIAFGKPDSTYVWTEGRYPVWIVLDPEKTNTGEEGMFLLSKGLVQKTSGVGANFAKSIDEFGNYFANDANVWAGSGAQAWCQEFLKNVFSKDSKAIIKTTTDVDEQTTINRVNDGAVELIYFKEQTKILDGDQIFFPSLKEVLNPDYGFDSENPSSSLVGYFKDKSMTEAIPQSYWLRNAIYYWDSIDKKYVYNTRVGCVQPIEVGGQTKGQIWSVRVNANIYSRPAFNLNKDAVLFTSAVNGGKNTGELGPDALTATSIWSVDKWKFTLLDDGSKNAVGDGHKGFSAERVSFDGKKLVFSYVGAKTYENDYVSAIVTNDTASCIKYYGRITKGYQNPGVELNLEGKYEKGDRVFVFNEQISPFWDGYDYTGNDYSSQLVEINMTPDSYNTRPKPVSLNQNTASLNVGENIQLTAKVTNTSNQSVIWTSSDVSVATVSSNGLVEGVGVGTADITAEAVDGRYTATCKVAVTKSDGEESGSGSGGISSGGSTSGGTGSVDAAKTRLVKTSKGTQFYKDDGSFAKNEWVTVDGVQYYFNDDGYNASNEWRDGKWISADGSCTYKGELKWKNNSTGWWVEDSEGWYPQSQWQKIDGIWYYFKPDGYMASNEYYNGYWFNEDGSWDDTYYLTWKSNSIGWWVEDKSGWWPSSKWLKIDGSWYYFNASGYMATNQYVDGYWVGSDGVCQ